MPLTTMITLMRRRDFLLVQAAVLLQSCTPALLRNHNKFQPLAPYSMLHVEGPLSLRATLLDPVCGTCAYLVEQQHNPTLVIEQNQFFNATIKSSLPQPAALHWHGLKVPAIMDGDGRTTFSSSPSETPQSAAFTVSNRSGLYWYHAHAHGYSAEQIHHGLAGMIVVRDTEDQQLDSALATQIGSTHLALMLKDTLWINGVRTPFRRDASNVAGLLGNVVTVNDLVAPSFTVSPGWVRLRLLNASNTRALLINAALRSQVHALQMHLLGTDGGLLANPISVKQIFLHPGERIDVAIDLSALKQGDAVAIESGEFDPRNQLDETTSTKPMQHYSAPNLAPLAANSLCAGANENTLPDGTTLPLFTLTVNESAAREGRLPEQLSTLVPAADDGSVQRTIALAFSADVGWTINGLRGNDPALTQYVKRGTREIWELHNSPISVPHPMHLHGFSFRVLSRRGLFGPARALANQSNNRVATDLGIKDTVTVWPNERVRIAIDFSHSFSGEQRYLFHCHNLQHEDQMMMLPVVVS
jgi:blue copper oxidase